MGSCPFPKGLAFTKVKENIRLLAISTWSRDSQACCKWRRLCLAPISTEWCRLRRHKKKQGPSLLEGCFLVISFFSQMNENQCPKGIRLVRSSPFDRFQNFPNRDVLIVPVFHTPLAKRFAFAKVQTFFSWLLAIFKFSVRFWPVWRLFWQQK